MYIGHYAAGYVLKKRYTEVPLWLLFISVQLVDIITFIFILLGIERIKYNASTNPFFQGIVEYVPYSHSLFANLILSFIVFLIFWKIKNKVWGIVLFLGVLSHWFLDLLVHVPDLPLFHNSLKVGLGLCRFPWIAFFLELSILIIAGYYFLNDNYKVKYKVKRHIFLITFLSIGFASMFFASKSETISIMASIFSLAFHVVTPTIA